MDGIVNAFIGESVVFLTTLLATVSVIIVVVMFSTALTNSVIDTILDEE